MNDTSTRGLAGGTRGLGTNAGEIHPGVVCHVCVSTWFFVISATLVVFFWLIGDVKGWGGLSNFHDNLADGNSARLSKRKTACIRSWPKARRKWEISAGAFAEKNRIEINWVVVSSVFYFHPYLGKISNLTNIFQLGWNDQLVKLQRIFWGFLWRYLWGPFFEAPGLGFWESKKTPKIQKRFWRDFVGVT